MQIDFLKCREKIAGSLNDFCSRWCKREHVECDALKDWKLNIFNVFPFNLKILTCYHANLRLVIVI